MSNPAEEIEEEISPGESCGANAAAPAPLAVEAEGGGKGRRVAASSAEAETNTDSHQSASNAAWNGEKSQTEERPNPNPNYKNQQEENGSSNTDEAHDKAVPQVSTTAGSNDKKNSNYHKPPEERIYHPNTYDVLLGRGKPYQNHMGNQEMLR
jgi:hypothetical protein